MAWSEDHLHAFSACRTPDEVFQLLQGEAELMGMRHVSWGMQLPLPSFDVRTVLHTDYPKAWDERYRSSGYIAIDPTVKRGLGSVSPILWSETMDEEQEFWEEAQAFGLKVGIAQSVFDRQGIGSMLSLSRDATAMTQTELRETAPKLTWLARLAHDRMSGLVIPNEVPEAAADLTEREKDALRWAALGKSAGMTAQILGISEKAVRKARESAAKKLGAHNLTQSLLMATRLRLL